MFTYRYSEAAMKGLYQDYRGIAYLKARQAWEPTYTVSLNSDIGGSEQVLTLRRQVIRSAIERNEHALGRSACVVVDIGGDCGQFIPPEFLSKYVLDVSASLPVSGVKKIKNMSEVLPSKPDLILFCGILEHVPNPIGLLNEYASHEAKASKVMFYVEVPFGVPEPRLGLQQILGWFLALLSSRSRTMWCLLDRYLARCKRRDKQSLLSVLRQSEHINFFSEAGLVTLLKNCGLEVCETFTYEMSDSLSTSGRLEFQKVLCAVAVGSPKDSYVK